MNTGGYIIEGYVKQLEFKIDNLRCCGNCKNWICQQRQESVERKDDRMCESWAWDGLTQEQRKI